MPRAVPAGDRLCFRLVCRRWAAAGKAVAPGAGEEQLPPGKVMRTSMLDMAASVARAKMMLGVLKDSPILINSPEGDMMKITPEELAMLLCAFSAGGGHLAVLKWARAHGCRWNEVTCEAAAAATLPAGAGRPTSLLTSAGLLRLKAECKVGEGGWSIRTGEGVARWGRAAASGPLGVPSRP